MEYLLYYEDVKVNCNENIVNLTITLINDGIHDTVSNITIETFVEIEKVVSTVVIKIPASSKDKEYQREVFRTSIDFQRFFNGVEGGFISKVIRENLLKSIEFDLKFPFKAVITVHRTIYSSSIMDTFFSGNL